MYKVGRYEIIEIIGHGGQSVAFKARDPKIDRIVAIKQIRLAEGIPLLLREEFYARFLREAQAAGRLSHPNIATIYDIGGEEEGVPYIAMEFIDGINLDDLLQSEHALPPAKGIRIFTQLCHALDYAHQCGIVHRDIKPGNVMITRDEQVKIVDFGIARLASSTLTQAGTVLGTPSYMSPEQIMGKSVDHRSDIFSLGVLLYEVLTGERPFLGNTPTAIVFKIVHQPHQPAHQLRPELIADFSTILDLALAKDPGTRYQRCNDMAKDLEKLATNHTEKFPTGPYPLASTSAPSTREDDEYLEPTLMGKPSLLNDIPAPAVGPPALMEKIAGAVGRTPLITWIAAAAGILLTVVAGAYFWARAGSTPAISGTRVAEPIAAADKSNDLPAKNQAPPDQAQITPRRHSAPASTASTLRVAGPPGEAHPSESKEPAPSSNSTRPAIEAPPEQFEKQAVIAALLPYRTEVRHDHIFGKGCEGRLTLTEADIRFDPVKQTDHALEVPLTAIRSIGLQKNRLEVVLTSGKKYSFAVPDPATVQKIVDGLK